MAKKKDKDDKDSSDDGFGESEDENTEKNNKGSRGPKDEKKDDKVRPKRVARAASMFVQSASLKESGDTSNDLRRRFSTSVFEVAQNRKLLTDLKDLRTIPKVQRRMSSTAMPLLEGPMALTSFADFEPSQPAKHKATLLERIRSRPDTRGQAILEEDETSLAEESQTPAAAPYVLVGVLSLVFGVLSVVPYNRILQSDPGSPLFIGFATHIFFVFINAPKLRAILFDRKIPLPYHLGFVTLGFLFTTLKSSAFVRLPTSLCMLLMNLQMLVAMVLQRLVFGDRYSMGQLSGCALVTIGVMVGGQAQKRASGGGGSAAELDSAALIGIAQMFGALVSLTALSMLVKVAFARFGEAVEEQIVMQHLGALPLFLLGGQWSQIGPRLASWTTGKDVYLILLLVVNMSITFVGQATQVQFAGRAPNLLLVQLVDTVKKFSSLLVTALLAAPPFPPLGFWLGSLGLVAGTVTFVTASQVPPEPEAGDVDKAS